MKKILLVDGNLLLFRSFYAAQVIVKDQPINMGIHLFFNTFLEIFKKENYQYVFFAFDAIGPTWRHNEYNQYKSGRKKAPEDLYKLKGSKYVQSYVGDSYSQVLNDLKNGIKVVMKLMI